MFKTTQMQMCLSRLMMPAVLHICISAVGSAFKNALDQCTACDVAITNQVSVLCHFNFGCIVNLASQAGLLSSQFFWGALMQVYGYGPNSRCSCLPTSLPMLMANVSGANMQMQLPVICQVVQLPCSDPGLPVRCCNGGGRGMF